ncbi:MAG TPA: PilZ domain-containing protein [Gemmataceae bacterium]|nr:PilZ domain-containing protein [Gemmataceae bacterium]
MTATDLKGIANSVVSRAKRQGYVLPREIRQELSQAGAPDSMWKDVLALARPSLSYRKGRYYYVPAVTERVRQEQDQQQLVRQAVEQLIDQYKSTSSQLERRGQNRIAFVQVIKAQTEDQRPITLLSRDLSVSGIRLIGTRSLLGQRVRIQISSPDGSNPWCFTVRILWTCAVGEDLFENGGLFVEAAPGSLEQPN